jgi:hypothetical protein
MKRPNLVNPQNWTPFRSIPNIPNIPSIPEAVPTMPSGSFVQMPEPIPIEIDVSRPMSRRELVQRNSFYLNLFCLIIILGIAYFLYSIYLERKIFSEYLEFIRGVEEEHYPGLL